MAIKDMKGTVSKGRPTMTGMMNERPVAKAPDMSGIKMPTVDKSKQVVEKPAPQNTPREKGLLQRVENLTDQDKATLGVVLSPSVSNVLSKVAPELNPLLSQFTKEEENVILPVSIVKNFAIRKYGGQTETESIQSFVSDLTGQMEQETTVPPETEAIDQDLA